MHVNLQQKMNTTNMMIKTVPMMDMDNRTENKSVNKIVSKVS